MCSGEKLNMEVVGSTKKNIYVESPHASSREIPSRKSLIL